jgi:hypothetical protein
VTTSSRNVTGTDTRCLLTEAKLKDARWPREAIHAFYFLRREMPEDDIRKGAAYLARTEHLDRIVALDDFDVETAAMLREYLHVPGMGVTTARAFRDKLAIVPGPRVGYPCRTSSRLNDPRRGVHLTRRSSMGPETSWTGCRDRHPHDRVRP